MNTAEVSRASKLARLSLLFAVGVVLVAIVESNISPLKQKFHDSGAFRFQCIATWLLGAAAAVYFGIRALSSRESKSGAAVAMGIVGLIVGAGVLVVFAGGMVVGILGR